MFDMNSMKRNAAKTAESREAETPREAAPAHKTHSPERSTSLATIGSSIYIKGDLSGDEDLVIQGHVEGTINLKQNNLTIGQEGKVNANIHAHAITIEGTVKGDVFGEDKVTIKRTGNVHGNVSAPRVSLEDGARFKGSMDMEQKRPDQAARNDSVSASVHKLDKAAGIEKTPFETKGAVK